jgi:hypothetical protein
MRQAIKIVVIAFIVLFYCNVTMAAEKPLIIKGLYIGMDINEARNILTQLLGKEWKLSTVGKSVQVLEDYRFGNTEIFGIKDDKSAFHSPPNVGDRGFAIIDHYGSYEGYISCDKNNDKVTRISFSGKLTDAVFSTAKIKVDDFVSSFWTNYDMPEFNWIPFGWMYTSPNGYTIKIKTNKLIDINKTPGEPVKQGEQPKIKFD